MSQPGTILLPIAGRSSRFPNLRPKWMLTVPDGRLMLECALSSVPDWRDCRVVIGALREHLDGLDGLGAIRRALGDAPEIINFDEPTSGPSTTVYEMIRRAGVRGPVFIKDCDSWFTPSAAVFDNVICAADLRRMKRASNVAAKSFVQLNENKLVVGIVEKSVVSNYISVGGYGFHDADEFARGHEAIERMGLSELFVSHVIMNAINRGTAFSSVEVTNYEDVGTLDAWMDFRARQSLYIVDLDGVVFKNHGEYTPPLWDDPDEALPNNLSALLALQQAGAQLVFLSARPERYRARIEATLAELGLKAHALVLGANHSPRLLINDFSASNPYPSALAVNVERDADSLATYLPKFERS